jgi:hypothetical protein
MERHTPVCDNRFFCTELVCTLEIRSNRFEGDGDGWQSHCGLESKTCLHESYKGNKGSGLAYAVPRLSRIAVRPWINIYGMIDSVFLLSSSHYIYFY